MQKTGEDPRDPRSVWNEIFHKEKKPKIGRDGKEKKQADPEKVEGLGDEAFWVGMQIGSTLYVLKNETVINISTGGPGDPAAKREKLKALAAVVLRSL